jgi:hypothetical protein
VAHLSAAAAHSLAAVRAFAASIAFALLLPGLHVAHAEVTAEEATAERHIKAAYLHRFAGYVEWPESAFARADSPLVIGVWGNDELAADLGRLVANRQIEGRPVEVHRVKSGDSPQGLHMLYVQRDRTARLAELLAGAPGGALLIVTDSSAGLRSGAAINFVPSNGQIRFEVSPQAAERNGLRLSSRLVAVAINGSDKAQR